MYKFIHKVEILPNHYFFLFFKKKNNTHVNYLLIKTSFDSICISRPHINSIVNKITYYSSEINDSVSMNL